jgi:hypothetical protein
MTGPTLADVDPTSTDPAGQRRHRSLFISDRRLRRCRRVRPYVATPKGAPAGAPLTCAIATGRCDR